MTAADDVVDARAAVTARIAALKQLGFEDALRNLLQVHRGRSAEGQVTFAAAAAGDSARAASPSTAAAAAGLAAAAASSEASSQDLVERVQTALQQLGVSER
jgi:hypothetical protein